MKRLGLFVMLAGIAILTQGCVSEIKQYDSTAYMVHVKGVNRPASTYSINVATTTTIADTVAKITKQLVKSLKDKRVGSVAITSFVDLHQLNKTTHFGRIMSESFFDELNKHNIDVIDFRGQKAISVNASGEFFLTRDIKKLRKTIENTYVLVGTYSKIEEGVLINSRIIDNLSGKVIASSRVVFHSTDCRLFEDCKQPAPYPKTEPLRRINLTTDGCSTVKCPENCSHGNCSSMDQ